MRAIQIFVITTGGLIVLGLLLLFLASRRPGAGRVNASVELDAPPAVAIAWLTEPAKLRRWVGLLSEVKGDTSAAILGRKQEWVMDDGKTGALTMQIELTGWAPPDSMRVRMVVPGMVEGDNRYVLESLGARTRLSVLGQYHHPNPIILLLEPLVTPEAQAKLQSDLARLREAIAAASADTASVSTGTTDTAKDSLGATH